MDLYVHVYEFFESDKQFHLQAKFASVLDALDYYEMKKKQRPETRLMLIDTFHHQQVDTYV